MTPVFDCRSLVFRYPDGRAALRGVDLTVHAGERIALVGQNGAGKTTLAKHLNGLLRPEEGSVLFRGTPLNGDNLRATRLRVGMLFQDPDDQLFTNTLNEDVAFGPFNQGLDRDGVESRVQAALSAVGLQGMRYKAPHHLSYGQKKRAALATLLAMNPEVLILDEPTSNLDPRQETLIVDLLRGFAGTLICISHDLPFLFGLCTRAVVLDRGRVHHDFSMQDLVADRACLREHGLDFTFRLSCCVTNGEPHPDHHPHTEAPTPPSSRSTAPDRGTADALIRLEGYSYRYPDGTWGVREVDLTVHEGEKVAIVGENGAGKSTLVSCLAGLLKGEGTFHFDGKPVVGRVRKDLWRNVGLAFQDPADQLFCSSCGEEVAFGLKQMRLSSDETAARVEWALRQVRLVGYENRVPHHLSAGERKRLALATVLAMRPRLLILDEPTANLDPRSEELLCRLLGQLDVTTILISHDMDIVSLLCRRMVVMHRGRVVRDAPTAVLFNDHRLLSENGLDYTFRNACCREILKLREDVSPVTQPLAGS